MSKIKVGDRIRTPHPAGHDLLGEVLSVQKRSTEMKAIYCEIKFDNSVRTEWVAIELIEVVKVRSNTKKSSIEEPVIKLGKSKPQSVTEQELDTSSLTHLLPPVPGSSIAASAIIPNAVGWVECKVIKGRNYYYLRGAQMRQRYLGATWSKAIDRLPGYLAPLAQN